LKKPSKQFRNGLINALIIIGTVGIVIWLGLRNADAKESIRAVMSSDIRYLAIGFLLWALSMAAEALVNQLFFIWQKVNVRFLSTLHITLLGMFYSNVTPAATGGQPMQVLAFKKRGVPVGVSTSGLAVKFFCFQFALLIGGTILWNLRLDFVRECAGGAKWIILLGFMINGISVLFVLLLAFRRNIVRRLIGFILKVGTRLRLIRNQERLLGKVQKAVDDFGASVDMLTHRPLQIIALILVSVVQLTLLMSASYCVYLALGQRGHTHMELMTLQWLLFIAASFTPLPGASGAQEGGFYLLYEKIFPSALQIPALLLWRAITYYMALLVGLTSVIGESVRSIRHTRREGAKDQPAPAGKEE